MSNRLNHYIIRVPKEEAAFIYFQFEANEGLCFFSTLDATLGEPFRDIEIFSPMSLKDEMTHLLDYLASTISLQIRLHDEIADEEDTLYKNPKEGKNARQS